MPQATASAKSGIAQVLYTGDFRRIIAQCLAVASIAVPADAPAHHGCIVLADVANVNGHP
jgi:hypothetical protein